MLKNPTFYKILLICLAIAMLLFVIINYIYSTIHRDHWDEQALARQVALEQSALVSISDIEPFNYESSYMIVYGEDSEGERMIVWVAMEEEPDYAVGREGGGGSGSRSNGPGSGIGNGRTVTDDVYGVVDGKESGFEVQDEIGDEVEGDDSGIRVVHAAYESEGSNRNLLSIKMREKEPDVHIIRMTPGKYKADWVWEVYYKKSKQDKRTYYDYYRFSDGELLTTLTMGLK